MIRNRRPIQRDIGAARPSKSNSVIGAKPPDMGPPQPTPTLIQPKGTDRQDSSTDKQGEELCPEWVSRSQCVFTGDQVKCVLLESKPQ